MFKEPEQNIKLEGPKISEANMESRKEMQKRFLDLEKSINILLSTTKKKDFFNKVVSDVNALGSEVNKAFPSYQNNTQKNYIENKNISILSLLDDLDTIERFLWSGDIGLSGFEQAYNNLNNKLKVIEKEITKKEPEFQVA